MISEIIKFPIGVRLSEGSAAGVRTLLRVTQERKKTRAAKNCWIAEVRLGICVNCGGVSTGFACQMVHFIYCG